MRPSLFQTKLDSGATRCDVCQWRCELLPGQQGRCQVRRNIDGVVQNEADELISAATIKPIEDLRMWHFFPDAQTFTVGSFGTPLLPQQTPPYGVLPTETTPRAIPAERVAAVAQERLCRGVMWMYNDPVISLEWMVDGLKLRRQPLCCHRVVGFLDARGRPGDWAIPGRAAPRDAGLQRQRLPPARRHRAAGA